MQEIERIHKEGMQDATGLGQAALIITRWLKSMENAQKYIKTPAYGLMQKSYLITEVEEI